MIFETMRMSPEEIDNRYKNANIGDVVDVLYIFPLQPNDGIHLTHIVGSVIDKDALVETLKISVEIQPCKLFKRFTYHRTLLLHKSEIYALKICDTHRVQGGKSMKMYGLLYNHETQKYEDVTTKKVPIIRDRLKRIFSEVLADYNTDMIGNRLYIYLDDYRRLEVSIDWEGPNAFKTLSFRLSHKVNGMIHNLNIGYYDIRDYYYPGASWRNYILRDDDIVAMRKALLEYIRIWK